MRLLTRLLGSKSPEQFSFIYLSVGKLEQQQNSGRFDFKDANLDLKEQGASLQSHSRAHEVDCNLPCLLKVPCLLVAAAGEEELRRS